LNLHERHVSLSMLVGVFLINLLLVSLGVTTLFFVVGLSMSALNMWVTVACSVLICYFMSARSLKDTLFSAVVGLVILYVIIVVCNYGFDWSFDGNTYHKSITGQLQMGWNPLRESFYQFADDHVPFLANRAQTWYDAYPKGSEIFAAAVYCVTGNIESGKAFNILSIVALFCICKAFLNELGVLKRWQSIVCALTFVLNPVAIIQVFTYYNDAMLGHILLLCLMALLYLTFYPKGRYENLCYYFIFASINIGFNIKFSGIIFFAILCLSFFFYWSFDRIVKEGFSLGAKKFVFKRFCVFAISVISGTVFLGASSYVTNIIRYRNPFYTMIGEGSTDLITAQLPEAYRELSNVTRFIYSLFAPVHSGTLKQVELKIPFSFSAEEVLAATAVDTRIAGWGLFFSGIFIISIAVIYKLLRKYRDEKTLVAVTRMLTVSVIISVFIIPGLAWARYSVFLFYIPAIALTSLFIYTNQNKESSQIALLVSGALLMLLVLNSVPVLGQNWTVLKDYKENNAQLEEFKEIALKQKVVVNTRFEGRIFTLIDRGIIDFGYEVYDPEVQYEEVFVNRPVLYRLGDVTGADSLQVFMKEVDKLNNYILIIAAKDDASYALTPEIVTCMQDSGLEFSLPGKFQYAYLAVIEDGNVIYEHTDEDRISFEEMIAGHRISAISAGFEKGNIASIKVNGREFSMDERGLNFVLLDKQTGEIIDSVRVDTFKNNILYRERNP